MTYRVIARKWRPQSFADVVGQETVTKTLRNALGSGRIAHAFLFSGVRGVGKTTTARILAKALNCHQGISQEPCNECPSCVEIAEGNSVDVLEIDAASNRGIDSIRELRESVRYGTARDRFKIYIIDEVHMLTSEAFNALLKTLEEPPGHVKFILATTEFQKIPATIASRCQRFDFKPIPFRLIQDRLRLICQSEGIGITDYALATVAAAGQGSMRDAQSALDQLIAFSGDEISDEDVRILLGIPDQSAVGALLKAIRGGEREQLMACLEHLVGSGLSPLQIAQKLIERVRNVLVFKVAGWDPDLLRLPDSDRADLEAQAGEFSELDLIRLYDVLNRTAGELRWQVYPEIHLELALLKLVEVMGLPSIEEVIGRLQSVAGGEGVGKTLLENEQERAAAVEQKRSSKGPGVPRKEASQTENASSEPSASPAKTSIVQPDWRERFVDLFSELQTASQIALEGDKLNVRFRAGDEFDAKVLMHKRDALKKACAEILGNPVTDVRIELEKNPAPQQKQRAEVQNLERSVLQDPRVEEFLRHFPGRTVVKKQP